jgi:hypothetical protein
MRVASKYVSSSLLPCPTHQSIQEIHMLERALSTISSYALHSYSIPEVLPPKNDADLFSDHNKVSRPTFPQQLPNGLRRPYNLPDDLTLPYSTLQTLFPDSLPSSPLSHSYTGTICKASARAYHTAIKYTPQHQQGQ